MLFKAVLSFSLKIKSQTQKHRETRLFINFDSVGCFVCMTTGTSTAGKLTGCDVFLGNFQWSFFFAKNQHRNTKWKNVIERIGKCVKTSRNFNWKYNTWDVNANTLEIICSRQRSCRFCHSLHLMAWMPFGYRFYEWNFPNNMRFRTKRCWSNDWIRCWLMENPMENSLLSFLAKQKTAVDCIKQWMGWN